MTRADNRRSPHGQGQARGGETVGLGGQHLGQLAQWGFHVNPDPQVLGQELKYRLQRPDLAWI
jgi:hypothetical protein